jgi:hypothetical protein
VAWVTLTRRDVQSAGYGEEHPHGHPAPARLAAELE